MASVGRITRKLALTWKPEDPEKNPWLRCKTVPGLCLRVRKSSGEIWRRELYVCYRWHGKNRFKMLGLLEEWGLERAIETVRDVRYRAKQAQIRGEPDPVRLADVEPREAVTMRDLSAVYQERSTKASKKDDEGTWRRALEKPLPDGSALGERSVLEVTPADLWAIRASMEETPVAFNRLMGLLSNAFNLAPQFGLVDPKDLVGWSNPCISIERFEERNRERIFSVEEYAALRRAIDILIDEALSAGSMRRQAKFRAVILLSMRIMARTGMRPVEIRELRQEEVHWTEGFADTRKAKADRKGSRKGRLLAFGPRAFEDLKAMAELSAGSPCFMPSWVDPSRPMNKQGNRRAWKTVKLKADEWSRGETGLGQDSEADLYSLRHTFTNRHARAGVDIADIHDFIGHRSAKKMITHTYRHTDVPRLLEIALQMEEHMDSLIPS